MQDKLDNFREYLIGRLNYHTLHFEKYIVKEEEYLASDELQSIIDTENLLKRLETYKV